MAAFQLDYNAAQDDTGLVTITDISPWGTGNNDENYIISDFTRVLTLKDADDNVIATINFNSTDLSETYQVPDGTNPWIKIDFSATDGTHPYDKLKKFPFQRIYELAFIDAIRGGCGCCDNKFPFMAEVDTNYQGAVFAAVVGDGESYQNNINAAYNYLLAD